MEFEEGAWYWGSDGMKWKIKVILGNLVLARRRFWPITEAFLFDNEGRICLDTITLRSVVIDPEWRVK